MKFNKTTQQQQLSCQIMDILDCMTMRVVHLILSFFLRAGERVRELNRTTLGRHRNRCHPELMVDSQIEQTLMVRGSQTTHL